MMGAGSAVTGFQDNFVLTCFGRPKRQRVHQPGRRPRQVHIGTKLNSRCFNIVDGHTEMKGSLQVKHSLSPRVRDTGVG
jgi:hypothetical protein